MLSHNRQQKTEWKRKANAAKSVKRRGVVQSLKQTERQEKHAQRKEIAAARKYLKHHYGVSRILTKPESNPKVFKNSKLNGILTSPLHFAPAIISGYQVCAMATKGCELACLHTAGNPVYMPNKTKARIAKTIAFFEARDLFMLVLYAEIVALTKRAAKLGQWAGVRLNATSDIVWESVSFNLFGKRVSNIFELFPDVHFYDYTKRHNRKGLPENYHLTFSLAESNVSNAAKFLESGGNVAVVFKGPLPSTFRILGVDYPVINGDLTDFRPHDGNGLIVGLKAKGKAEQDKTGFVQSGALHDTDAEPAQASLRLVG